MICTSCNKTRLVSVAIRYKTDNKDKGYQKIGLYCVKCNIVSDFTEFLTQKQIQVEKKTRKPIRFKNYNEKCSECEGVRIDIKTIKESIKVEFDKGQNETKVHRNNGYKKCKCKKCGHTWRTSIATPENPKYIIPPKLNKEHLKLILMRVPKNQLTIPKNKKKIVNIIFEEFKKEQEEKEKRDSKK